MLSAIAWMCWAVVFVGGSMTLGLPLLLMALPRSPSYPKSYTLRREMRRSLWGVLPAWLTLALITAKTLVDLLTGGGRALDHWFLPVLAVSLAWTFWSLRKRLSERKNGH